MHKQHTLRGTVPDCVLFVYIHDSDTFPLALYIVQIQQ